ncbi:hypothetical protein [Herbaspirillum robiniae]|uniref:hypothetical protein n=1 Tax=Herbaspirillum robiniae TaxID=2014887 RepID=UPI003D785CA1
MGDGNESLRIQSSIAHLVNEPGQGIELQQCNATRRTEELARGNAEFLLRPKTKIGIIQRNNRKNRHHDQNNDAETQSEKLQRTRHSPVFL